MDLQKRKKELEDALQKAQNQYNQLGTEIQRIIGAISIINEQLEEEVEPKEEE